MPWVRLDDRFPAHRKVATLTDRAFRLHVSALCWCAANLTDGHISDKELRLVAHVRGMTATARQLEDAGLWVRVEDGWMLHDFHDYQPTADHVRAERERNAARQKRFRDRKNAPSDSSEESEDPPRNGVRNGVTNGVSHPVTNSAPSRTRPVPVPGSIPGGIEPSPLPPPERPRADAPGVPPFAQALADQLAAAGCHLQWRTDSDDRQALRRHLDRVPVPRLVDAARRAWNPANPPRSIRYLIKVWDGTPDAPAGSPNAPVRLPVLDRQQQASNDLFDRAMARARARMAAAEAAPDTPKALTA
ncbi:hypothetical protein [Streptomyces hiroshimensis]|uniref:Uncharacterized protein n=1 Tax=Streptomyces hiroshimensis TaxID=66424 RepID=A0ABQ2Y641_9ACTN|nr:hypothetical protein [Streptomyces hiroshimensis]GGX63365.1 hypothetical protein GCM10010324_05140 [Streptomyces hiroshimensis]